MNKSKFVLAGMSFAFISGCASLGDGEFECSEIQQGVGCQPASVVYEMAGKPGFEDGVTQEKINNYNSGRSAQSSQQSENALSRRGNGEAYGQTGRSGEQPQKFFGEQPVLPPYEQDQLFILNPPKADPTDPERLDSALKRIWVAPWVSSAGVWHGDQVLWIEVAKPRWKNGVINADPKVPIFTPLK